MLSSGEDYIMSEANAIRYLSFVYMIIFGFNNKHLYTLITFCLFWGGGGIIDEILYFGPFCGSKSGFSGPYYILF